MSAFLDSSAVLKRYLREDGSSATRALEAMAVSSLARVEVGAALRRKQREGVLGAVEADALIASVALDCAGTRTVEPVYRVVPMREPVIVRAVELCGRHALRAYDALQLASAHVVREIDTGCDTFACFDARLRDTAAAEGFLLLPA